MEIADHLGGAIINADALQVFSNWRILTARPSTRDEAQLPHRLYGHVPGDRPYSVGKWLQDVTPLLTENYPPIIVGGTGLYFSALTNGLADIPRTPKEIRARADNLLAQEGLDALLLALDPDTLARIDRQNPMRVQRAWEVQQTTGRGLASWQDETPPALLPLSQTQTILLAADRDWLNARIARRFEWMLEHGALDEARANQPAWSPSLPSSKAIGATELMAYLAGTMDLAAARDSATTGTRQYAKRQRSWFRARMRDWQIHQVG